MGLRSLVHSTHNQHRDQIMLLWCTFSLFLRYSSFGDPIPASTVARRLLNGVAIDVSDRHCHAGIAVSRFCFRDNRSYSALPIGWQQAQEASNSSILIFGIPIQV
jgi:hypothetical protein